MLATAARENSGAELGRQREALLQDDLKMCAGSACYKCQGQSNMCSCCAQGFTISAKESVNYFYFVVVFFFLKASHSR